MTAEAILAAIAAASRWAIFLSQIGANAAPIIAKIAEWSARTSLPTATDFEEMYAMGKPAFDKLNDMSRDRP